MRTRPRRLAVFTEAKLQRDGEQPQTMNVWLNLTTRANEVALGRERRAQALLTVLSLFVWLSELSDAAPQQVVPDLVYSRVLWCATSQNVDQVIFHGPPSAVIEHTVRGDRKITPLPGGVVGCLDWTQNST